MMCDDFDANTIDRDLERMGVTALDFCRRAKVPESTWRRLRNEGRKPREATKRALIRALNSFRRDAGKEPCCR